jgi:transcriptional regulator with XRE-family HTH domain
MDDFKKNLGLRIKELRRIKTINQKQLAEMIGIGHKHLWLIEAGDNCATAAILEDIAAKLNIEMREFFTFFEMPKNNALMQDLFRSLRDKDPKKVVRAYNILISSYK